MQIFITSACMLLSHVLVDNYSFLIYFMLSSIAYKTAIIGGSGTQSADTGTDYCTDLKITVE